MLSDHGEARVIPRGWRQTATLGGIAVVAVGILLRFWTRSHLWLDEALTVNVARLPLSQIPHALRHDGAPPLYYYLLHVWMAIFGTSALAVRALSGVISVATIPVMAVAGRRLGGPKHGGLVSVASILLLASSPFAVRFATEARMYSLVILLVLIGYLALARALEDNGSQRPANRDLGMIALVSGLLLLTHYWALYLIPTVLCLLAVHARHLSTAAATSAPTSTPPTSRQARRAVYALVAVAAGGILFLPWLPAFLYQSRHTGTPWAEPASFSAMVNAISEFAGGRSSTGRALALTFFALAGFGLFGAPIDRVRVELDLRTRPAGRGVAIVTAATLAVAITVGLATHNAFAARYTSVVFAPFLLLVTLGLTVFIDRRVLTLVMAAAIGFGLLTSTSNVRTDRTEAAKIAATIRREVQPGDVVGYCPDQLGPSTSRLLPSGLRQLTFPAEAGPRFVDWVDYAQHNRAGDPAMFARDLNEVAGPSHTVWLVWASEYRTLGTKCEEISRQLTALRPNANQLIGADTQHFFEHAALVRYLPQ